MKPELQIAIAKLLAAVNESRETTEIIEEVNKLADDGQPHEMYFFVAKTDDGLCVACGSADAVPKPLMDVAACVVTVDQTLNATGLVKPERPTYRCFAALVSDAEMDSDDPTHILLRLDIAARGRLYRLYETFIKLKADNPSLACMTFTNTYAYWYAINEPSEALATDDYREIPEHVYYYTKMEQGEESSVEGELMHVDETGIHFTCYIKHTDTRIESRCIEWAKLVGPSKQGTGDAASAIA